jgi:phosphoenolpyruvate phosphomutase
MKKTTQLRELICSGNLEFIMEAHNGLSAKIVEETGFKGIWGSGLSISASLGVRDNNEASWTQVLDVLEFMSDGTSIPILLDGDTGYGNFNNMRRLVRKLEQRDIAGVCIEDKLFPKTNSFIAGETQPLADIEEFCGKIKAAKDTQNDSDFNVVARVEAFIAGWGLQEALRRAEAYRLAGADAVLIHSKKNNPSDIEMFMKEWGNRLPVVIVPTKYYTTPTDRFRELGISLVIWANHNIRSATRTMQEVSKKIYDEESLIHVEDKIASVSELFRLQNADELKEAELRYLPASRESTNSIILAASQGNLGELTAEIPKTLLKVNGKSILATQIDEFNQVGIKDITVVRGFGKQHINLGNIFNVDNDQHAETKELYSLYLAKEKIAGNTIISYGDIVYRIYILNDLISDKNDITLIADADFDNVQDQSHDFVIASKPWSKKLYDQTVGFVKMGSELKKEEINGEFIGLWKVSKTGADWVKAALEKLSVKEDFKQMTTTDLLNEIVKEHPIAIKYIKGSWIDVDTIADLYKATEIKC